MKIEGLVFSVEQLRKDADEIAGSGGGNEAACMRWAADEIERLRNVADLWEPKVKHVGVFSPYNPFPSITDGSTPEPDIGGIKIDFNLVDIYEK